ncbi:MAG TPA: hypothetical protein VEV87_04895 [Chitinophagaceae bacterium]|nr:hypothetical protein [Chitinophagaceae bacterium]
MNNLQLWWGTLQHVLCNQRAGSANEKTALRKGAAVWVTDRVRTGDP